ncbi:adenylate/guanylate cyclase domain-containing protein [uncultured Jatrophihabitans sp.]|uniref:adenylate/guanylate cyclase domain-containing protein n=1 Tax=uncultured Jatrophihabitans sp. TaxID=1610747 RepID=UPI0035CB97E5
MRDEGVTAELRAVLSGIAPRDGLPSIARASRALIAGSIVLANLIGAGVVVTLLSVVLPIPRTAQTGSGLAGLAPGTLLFAFGYVVVAIAVGLTAGLRLSRPVLAFYTSDDPPDARTRDAVLRLPVRLLRLQAGLWTLATIAFGALAFSVTPLYGFEVTITVALGGTPTACLAYLQTQRLLRAGVARVLADAPPRPDEVPGVGPRAYLAWALGVVPVGGIVALAVFTPFTDPSSGDLARAVGVLAGVSIAVGALAVQSFSRAVTDPLQRMRDAFTAVQAGDFDVQVPVFDATEIGYASAGFNRMTAGLRERERLRDLFGRQVGSDVARQALEQGVRLGGEELHAAALFVDVIGSTSFAQDRSPTEVVDALNEFFGAVVEATQRHGGLINKFIGDAALCIFGAPLHLDDPAGAALAAARDMARLLSDGELKAGIGVSIGTVVAGNVGTAERYEYTIIGDPVNEAARLTDLAKSRSKRVIASGEAVDAADETEARHWQDAGEETLRGRDRATRLAEPRA